MTIHASIRCQMFQHLEDCHLLFLFEDVREFVYRPGAIGLLVQRTNQTILQL